jgi:hypothetical protein
MGTNLYWRAEDPLDSRDRHGVLLEMKGVAGGAEDVARFVRVVDPSTGRQYALCVPREIETAHAAVAWGFHRTPETYAPESES